MHILMDTVGCGVFRNAHWYPEGRLMFCRGTHKSILVYYTYLYCQIPVNRNVEYREKRDS